MVMIEFDLLSSMVVKGCQDADRHTFSKSQHCSAEPEGKKNTRPIENSLPSLAAKGTYKTQSQILSYPITCDILFSAENAVAGGRYRLSCISVTQSSPMAIGDRRPE